MHLPGKGRRDEKSPSGFNRRGAYPPAGVRGMMPRNTVTKDSLKRLHIYAGEAHEQQAQKPEVWEVK